MFTVKQISNFNELEFSIYNCIITHKEEILDMSIQELAKMAHVSTATILRFCKKFGYQGYSHFKLAYKDYLEKTTLPLTDLGETTLKNFISYISYTEFQKSIESACQLLKQASLIIFIGISSSGNLAKYGARYFSNLGFFSLYIEDPWFPIQKGLAQSTVTIALSESGETIQTNHLAAQLKEYGSLLLAITNTSQSTLAQLAHCAITYHVPHVRIDGLDVTTQVPVIYILETLAHHLHTSQ